MLGRSPRLSDPADARFLTGGIRLGALATLVVCLSGVVYYSTSWDRPHRPLLLGLSIAFGVVSLAMLPARFTRLVEGRWRDLFFGAWSAVSVTAMALVVALDGGGRTPAAFGMALPLAFAGLMYPLRGAMAIAVLDIAAYLGFSLLVPHETGELVFATATLGCLAGMCVWTAWWQGRQRAELARLSRTDPLTGCLNRRGLEAHVARAVADGAPFALVTLDLDDFKDVNDRGGHAAGDVVLRDTVRVLGETVRPGDAIGRLGGDEFALVLPGADAGAAAHVRERAALALSGTVAASFGSAVFPADGCTNDALFRHADAALYRAKGARSGRAYGAARLPV